MREGHQSEVLLSIAEEFPADLCFTLVFHGRQGNLDLVAASPEEAQAWIQGVRKLIHKAETMDEKERLDQYPFIVVGDCFWCFLKQRVYSGVSRYQTLAHPLSSLNKAPTTAVLLKVQTILKKCRVMDGGLFISLQRF